MAGLRPIDFKEFLTVLSRERVKFIVCGGVAAVLHGVERVTMDLDLNEQAKPGQVPPR